MINPLQVSLPRERKDGNGDSAAVSALREGSHGPADEAIMAVGCPSTSAILMFYRADFRRIPAVSPEFQLEGPCIREHQALAQVPTLETLRTFLRFSRKRSAVSGLPG